MFVTLRQVAHRFDDGPVLFQGLDITMEPGHTFALCGPSGCGKSTLLSILAGWVVPWHGRVERQGVTHIGWVFQNPYGVPARTALDHVVFPLLSHGMKRGDAEPRALDVLAEFGLSTVAYRPFSALSGGEAQRLMLARAVCAHPDMLLVDEPTAQLDTATARSVCDVLGELAGRGMIVVIATHDPAARAACDLTLDLARYAPVVGESVDNNGKEADG